MQGNNNNKKTHTHNAIHQIVDRTTEAKIYKWWHISVEAGVFVLRCRRMTPCVDASDQKTVYTTFLFTGIQITHREDLHAFNDALRGKNGFSRQKIDIFGFQKKVQNIDEIHFSSSRDMQLQIVVK